MNTNYFSPKCETFRSLFLFAFSGGLSLGIFLLLFGFSGILQARESPSSPVESLGEDRYRIGMVEVDGRKRSLSLPVVLNMKEEVVEYLLVTETGKTHESILSTKAKAMDIHLGALLLGAEKSSPVLLKGHLEWQGHGQVRRESLDDLLEIGEGGTRERTPFVNTGWAYQDPRKSPPPTLAAATSGSIISLITDPEALIVSTAQTLHRDDVHFPAPSHLPPKVQMPAKLVLIFPPIPSPPPVSRE